MTLFDMFGRWGSKPAEPPEFVDTVPVLHAEEEPKPVAAWPFPTQESHPVPNETIAELYEGLAADRAELKAELKAIVIEAPSLGIHFYHAGKTTIAWRHHNPEDSEHGGVRNPLLIDVAAALCNPRDQFAKWMGSAYAAQAMLDGRYITVKAKRHSFQDTSDTAVIQDAIEMMGLAFET